MPDDRPPQGAEYKSDAVKKLDAFFSGNTRADNRRYAREILADEATLAAVTEKAKGKLSLPDQQSKHFRDHWFTVGGDQVEQAMRRGYEDAINRAEPDNLPIETWWVWGSQIQRFEILVSTEQQRVKVLVRIPQQVFEAARGS
jgi:hypothetical protein